MNGMSSLADPELFSPARSLLELICSPEGGVLDCRDVMVVVAHPDDETIALGGQLSRMEGVRLLHVTDGAPVDMRDATERGFATREEYALARRKELEAVMGLAGIGSKALLSLAVPDQAAAHHMAELAPKLAKLFRDWGVNTVLTHAYEGGHPDHDATAFIVHAACHLLERSGRLEPMIFEFPLYHARQGQVIAQEFAPAECDEYAIALDEETRQAKRRMLAAFTTQNCILDYFQVKVERFRPAPRYDFHLLPNGGEVVYGRHAWGLRPSDWPRLVEEASRELDLPRWL